MAAVAFEADGAGGGDFEGGFEDFAVAGAMGDAAFDDDDHFVPVLASRSTPRAFTGIISLEDAHRVHSGRDEASPLRTA